MLESIYFILCKNVFVGIVGSFKVRNGRLKYLAHSEAVKTFPSAEYGCSSVVERSFMV